MEKSYRDIVVTVLGLTPQVITETLYYLTQVRQPAARPRAIHVLTTRAGAAQMQQQLLARPQGRFYRFCADYGLDPADLHFEIHTFEQPAGVPLDDIRTAADSAAVADQTLAVVRHVTRSPHQRVFASLAGGRKTQAVLLGFALQLYGRPHDILLHVLVDAAFENHPEFFYPPPTPRQIQTSGGTWLDAHRAQIDVAEIPFLRLSERLWAEAVATPIDFGDTIGQVQQALDALPPLLPLTIDPVRRRLYIGPHLVSLQPLQLVLYWQLALARLRLGKATDGGLRLDELDAQRQEMEQHYRVLYPSYSGHVERLAKQWHDNGLPWDTVRSHFSRINQQLRRVLGDAELASWYVITSKRQYGSTRYGLRVPPGLIHIEGQV